MKTQTTEGTLKMQLENFDDFTESDLVELIKYSKQHTTTQIEALRERLMKNATSVLSGVSIEQTINEFLKEINP
jgi:hypothetical protein